jgi:amino acid adenylation domain-containing protein
VEFGDVDRIPYASGIRSTSPNSPAYIFFTSGTTGTPKAVLGIHKSLSHFLAWQRDTFQIGPGDRCAQLTNASFDVVLRDIFLPLTSGATLCLPDDDMDPASDRILPWMEREGITSFHAVPTLAQAWLDRIPDGVRLSKLRWAFFAGEALTENLVRRWREALPDAGTIVNLYGPTETTLVKCFQVVHGEPSPGLQHIGSALPDTQVVILNLAGNLSGVGEPGEINIRTPFRTAGYINAPEEQKKRFVQNPFRMDPNDLIYRTGDRGRYRADGTVEFLGRVDDQVKIRGVRVEPAEINAILGRHARVSASFVKACTDATESPILVAYVVLSDRDEPAPNDLRSYLTERLPAAMAPSAFVFLDALPLTPNGKVDRRALPMPDLMNAKERGTLSPPRTPTERVVADVWCRVLKLQQVGIQDNFFDLGGHSLSAMQLISQIRSEFHIELPLRTIFVKPTIESLALHLDAEMESLPAQNGGVVHARSRK